MSNKTILQNCNNRLNTNNTDLDTILSKINNLPSTGETAEDLSTELTEQDTLITDQETTIEDVMLVLQNKASGGGEVNLQEKTVTPTTSSQNVIADAGYNGLSKVTVNAMPTATQATPSISVSSAGLITASSTQTAGYVAAGTKSATKQLTTKSATTYTPTTSNQTIASGTYLTGTQTIKGDSNLVAGNIKKGVSIFGVGGTLETTTSEDLNSEITQQDTLITNQENTLDSLIQKLQNKAAGGGNDTTIEDAMVTRTLSGDYVNNRVTSIGSEGLRATQITGLHCENVTTVGGEAVRQCNYLVNVYLPKCTNLSGYSFGICPLLERVELGAMTNIRAYDFYNCTNLTTLIINNTATVCSLANVSAFTGTGIASGTGYIYVPDALVNSYKTATNWSTYAAQIKGISEL